VPGDFQLTKTKESRGQQENSFLKWYTHWLDFVPKFYLFGNQVKGHFLRDFGL
jgi:hypothetical protein